jgi:small subunit ribosomal protein S19
MSRSKWKLSYNASAIGRLITRKKKVVWSRSSVIPKYLCGKKVFVHNGKEFKPVLITEDKVGYKFGEFSSTRKWGLNKNNKKTKNKRGK